MFGIQQKINRNAKKQENMTHNVEKNQSIEKDPCMTQRIESIDKKLLM